jgi:hypothetical protein
MSGHRWVEAPGNPGTFFCAFCGSVVESAIDCAFCGSVVESAQAHCTRCGAHSPHKNERPLMGCPGGAARATPTPALQRIAAALELIAGKYSSEREALLVSIAGDLAAALRHLDDEPQRAASKVACALANLEQFAGRELYER